MASGTVTADQNGVYTASVQAGKGWLTFGVYYTSEDDFGLSWNPGLEKRGLGGLNIDVSLGTDGLSVGGSATVGSATVGRSVPIHFPRAYTPPDNYPMEVRKMMNSPNPIFR